NPRGKDLYAWWGDRVTDALNDDLAAATPRGQKPLVVNLASNEYAAVVNKKRLEAETITPAFKDRKNGSYRMISFYAKRARGVMARWLVMTRFAKPLTAFGEDGYRYNAGLSTEATPVFTRDGPPAA
ncbi:MAG: peroxide stress protein YaaA, partial [Planctomycetota bacterium]